MKFKKFEILLILSAGGGNDRIKTLLRERKKIMKHLKAIAILFGITMAGEFLNTILPLPVPAGVYGLFILLFCLCSGLVTLDVISGVGDFLLDVMPLMFIPAAVGLMDSFEELKPILVPVLLISILSTLFVMAVTGRTAQFMMRKTRKKGEKR